MTFPMNICCVRNTPVSFYPLNMPEGQSHSWEDTGNTESESWHTPVGASYSHRRHTYMPQTQTNCKYSQLYFKGKDNSLLGRGTSVGLDLKHRETIYFGYLIIYESWYSRVLEPRKSYLWLSEKSYLWLSHHLRVLLLTGLGTQSHSNKELA